MSDKQGATQTGVPAATKPDLNDPHVRLSRADAMKVMADSRRAALVGEGVDLDAPATTTVVDEDTDTADAAAEAERARLAAIAAAAEQAEQGDQVDLDPETQVAAATGKKKAPVVIDDADLVNYQVRTKVNGVEQLETLDQVRAKAQKTDSADKYLGEAKTLLADVQQTIRAQGKAAPAVDAAAAGTAAPDTTSQEPDPIDKAIDALFLGDEKQTKALLRQAINNAAKGGGGKDVAAEAVATAVEQRIVIRSALRQFAKDHKQISSDPTLRRVADTFLMEATANRRLEEFSADEIPDLLEQAGTKTMEWLKAQSGVAPTKGAPATTRSEKLAAKQGIDELPSAAIRSTSTTAEPKSPTQIIEQMRVARGQPVAAT